MAQAKRFTVIVSNLNGCQMKACQTIYQKKIEKGKNVFNAGLMG